MKKKYLFVSCREGVSSIFSREYPFISFFLLIFLFVFPYLIFLVFHLFFLIFLSFPHSQMFFPHPFFSFLISHLSFLIYNKGVKRGCNVLKMKSYEILMQNIRLLQKEVLLLHLI